MGDPTAPAPVAVWYAAASFAGTERQPWLLRVTMTTAVDGGARHEQLVPDIEQACRLLRAWYGEVTAGR
jgi:hypothetical protein